MKTFFKTACLLLVAGILFIGCKGKDGAPGPIGATGVQGESGPKALTHTATGTFTNTTTSLTYMGLVGKITQYDAVFVYVLTKTDGLGVENYTLLPITYIGAAPNPVLVDFELAEDGFITFAIAKLDGTALPTGYSRFCKFKIVHIKGESGLRKAGIDYGNYEEVKAYYNLQD